LGFVRNHPDAVKRHQTALDEDFVHAATFAVHADRDPVPLQGAGEVVAGELAAVVDIENLEPAASGRALFWRAGGGDSQLTAPLGLCILSTPHSREPILSSVRLSPPMVRPCNGEREGGIAGRAELGNSGLEAGAQASTTGEPTVDGLGRNVFITRFYLTRCFDWH